MNAWHNVALVASILGVAVACGANGAADSTVDPVLFQPTYTPYPTYTPFPTLAIMPTATITGESPCSRQAYLDALKPIRREWDDAVAVAEQTPRDSLAPQVERLQEIYRTIEGLEVSECVEETHALYLRYTDYTVKGFIAFLGDKPDSQAQRQLDRAKSALEKWETELDRLD